MDGINFVYSKFDKYLFEIIQLICNCSGWNFNKYGVIIIVDLIYVINFIYLYFQEVVVELYLEKNINFYVRNFV